MRGKLKIVCIWILIFGAFSIISASPKIEYSFYLGLHSNFSKIHPDTVSILPTSTQYRNMNLVAPCFLVQASLPVSNSFRIKGSIGVSRSSILIEYQEVEDHILTFYDSVYELVVPGIHYKSNLTRMHTNLNLGLEYYPKLEIPVYIISGYSLSILNKNKESTTLDHYLFGEVLFDEDGLKYSANPYTLTENEHGEVLKQDGTISIGVGWAYPYPRRKVKIEIIYELGWTNIFKSDYYSIGGNREVKVQVGYQI